MFFSSLSLSLSLSFPSSVVLGKKLSSPFWLGESTSVAGAAGRSMVVAPRECYEILAKPIDRHRKGREPRGWCVRWLRGRGRGRGRRGHARRHGSSNLQARPVETMSAELDNILRALAGAIAFV
uniref:Putative secreted protein n=1 Tax=Anopheles triannulatus TaxID=58253 RepID=A0A2M4B484_9DIPT